MPWDSWALDLDAYVRRVMAGAESDVGRPLEWAAVTHTHSPHPHAHVVLRGLPLARHGSHTGDLVAAIRRHVEQIGPEGLGVEDDGLERPWDEIFAARFTLWDFRLAELAKDNILPTAAASAGDLNARVEGLEMMSLAQPEFSEELGWAQGRWVFAKGWLELLLDWGDEEETSDMTSVFAAARDVLPWRATVARSRRPLP